MKCQKLKRLALILCGFAGLSSNLLSEDVPLEPVDGLIRGWNQNWQYFARHAKAVRKPDLVAIYVDSFGEGLFLLRLKKHEDSFIFYLSSVAKDLDVGDELSKAPLHEFEQTVTPEFAIPFVSVMQRELLKTSYSGKPVDGHWTDGTSVVVSGYSEELQRLMTGRFHYPTNPSLVWISDIAKALRNSMCAAGGKERFQYFVQAREILAKHQ